MKDDVKQRVLREAKYLISKECTIRQTAKVCEISKTTVHRDITERLKLINPTLAEEVQIILQRNKEERHIRGGLATRRKYILD